MDIIDLKDATWVRIQCPGEGTYYCPKQFLEKFIYHRPDIGDHVIAGVKSEEIVYYTLTGKIGRKKTGEVIQVDTLNVWVKLSEVEQLFEGLINQTVGRFFDGTPYHSFEGKGCWFILSPPQKEEFVRALVGILVPEDE